MANRPIWRNRRYNSRNGSNLPQYEFRTNGELYLLNTIAEAGTPVNAENLNNLFDFDNLIANEQTTYTTQNYSNLNHPVTRTDTIRETSGEKRIVATRETVCQSDSNFSTTEKLYILPPTGAAASLQTRTLITELTNGEIKVTIG